MPCKYQHIMRGKIVFIAKCRIKCNMSDLLQFKFKLLLLLCCTQKHKTKKLQTTIFAGY